MPTIPKECDQCHEPLRLTAGQKRLLAKATEQQWPIVALQCSSCNIGFVVDISARTPKGEDAYTYRCPTSGCYGHVVKIHERATSPWGCGGCGGEWKSRAAVVEDIHLAIERYPYRARCYVKKRGDLLPGPASKEEKSYLKLVGDEPIEPGPTLPKKRRQPAAAAKRKQARKSR